MPRGRPAKYGINEPHPMNPDITLHQSRRGPDDKRWEATFRIDGQKIGPRSLGTTDRDKALFAAMKMHTDLSVALAKGEPTSQRKRVQHSFREIAEKTIRQLEEEPVANRVLIGNINFHLIPAFGDLPVTAITEEKIDEWTHNLRVKTHSRAKDSPLKRPNQNTVGNIAHAFKEVMLAASREGWIRKASIPKFSKAGFEASGRRPGITMDEMRKIAAALRSKEWMTDFRRIDEAENRVLLRAYVAIAAATGMRPGTEMAELRWSMMLRDDKGPYIHIPPHHGKRGADSERLITPWLRSPMSYESELRLLRSWHGEREAPPPDAFVFARPCDGVVPSLTRIFKHLLESLDLYLDPVSRQPRSLYSL